MIHLSFKSFMERTLGKGFGDVQGVFVEIVLVALVLGCLWDLFH
jgi:hypothetical protein